MTTAQWTTLLWTIIIFVGPLFVGVLLKLGQSFLLTRSASTQHLVEYWITFFIEAAQQQEPDPQKRKEQVVARVHALFPKLPEMQLEALIEGILNELKNQYADWNAHAAALDPGKEPVSGATFPGTN